MSQIQLSDAQAVMLSTACAREDAMVFPVTAVNGGAILGRGSDGIVLSRAA